MEYRHKRNRKRGKKIKLIVSLPMDLQVSFQIDLVLLEDATKTEKPSTHELQCYCCKVHFLLKYKKCILN